MAAAPDILIIGAGIVGAACARECALAGLRVSVLDQGPTAGRTTGAGMGHLVVMDDSPAQFALTRFSRQLWLDLAPQLPRDVEFDPCGTLWVAADEQEFAEVRRKEQYYSQRGVRVEVLDVPQLAAAEPSLRPGMAGGLRVIDDAVLYPPSAARFLLEQAREQGALLLNNSRVQRILPEGGVALADGTTVPAGKVLNAAGPWSPVLNPGLPVRKRKGHLVITDRYPGFVHHQLVELGYLKSAHSVTKDSVAFNIQPRKNGQMLIGSSRQYAAETEVIEQPILERMLARALEYLPGLARLSAIRAWTGYRAATPDKLPLLGPTSNPRVWLATGHEGLGITTALASGRLIADQLTGRASAIPAEPYLPTRPSLAQHQ